MIIRRIEIENFRSYYGNENIFEFGDGLTLIIGDNGDGKTTFFEGPIATHPSAADPYCPELRKFAIDTAKEIGITVHETGTVVVINGPRFSTKSESKFFTNQGWEVINMTAYPEAYLVKEMDMCPLNISLITDYDAGLVGDVAPVSHQSVIEVFNNNVDNLKKLLFSMIEKIPAENNNCDCANKKKNYRP